MNFLTLFISLRCTQSCEHCLYGCSPEHGEHMSQEVFNRALLIANNHRIPALNLFGGEPLLNPDILPMVETALKNDVFLIIATNCHPLTNDGLYTKFLVKARQFRERITIITARDQFHLKYFDPEQIIRRLRSESFEVIVQDYSNQTIALSEHNTNNQELRSLNTQWSCCNAGWTDYVGILPNGAWTICPPSLEPFGNIFDFSLDEILDFKRGLKMRYEQGCTECLKDFKRFRRIFEET
jgi:organic radical activating enzyme